MSDSYRFDDWDQLGRSLAQLAELVEANEPPTRDTIGATLRTGLEGAWGMQGGDNRMDLADDIADTVRCGLEYVEACIGLGYTLPFVVEPPAEFRFSGVLRMPRRSDPVDRSSELNPGLTDLYKQILLGLKCSLTATNEAYPPGQLNVGEQLTKWAQWHLEYWRNLDYSGPPLLPQVRTVLDLAVSFHRFFNTHPRHKPPVGWTPFLGHLPTRKKVLVRWYYGEDDTIPSMVLEGSGDTAYLHVWDQHTSYHRFYFSTSWRPNAPRSNTVGLPAGLTRYPDWLQLAEAGLNQLGLRLGTKELQK